MFKKQYYIITLSCIIILITTFTTSRYIQNKVNKKEKNLNNILNVGETGKGLQEDNINTNFAKTNYSDPLLKPIKEDKIQAKVNKDTKILITYIYLKCGHSETEQIESSDYMIGLGQEEFKQLNSQWYIESFNSDQIIISVNMDEKCKEHYILKEYKDKIGVFYQDNNELKEIINIDIRQLRQDDMLRLQKGIEINSKKELAEIMEDFAS